MTDVGTVMSRLQAQTSTRTNLFRLKIRKDSVQRLLRTAYDHELKARIGTTSEDAYTDAMCGAVAEALTDKESTTFGIMLIGMPGTGKTTMLRAIQRMINTMYDLNFCRHCVKLVDSMQITKTYTDADYWDVIKEWPILGIDDFGKEPTEVLSYGNAQSPMIELMEHRYNRQLYTIISSNLRTKDVREKYMARVADRFNEMFKVISFGNDTYRGKKPQQTTR